MRQIIPAIMPKNFRDIEDAVEQVKRYTDTVQIDIMDGTFVPNRSWPYPLPNPEFAAIANEDYGMPMWQTMNYELDLMVRHPDDNFEQWVKLGPARIIVHIESLADPMKFFESVQNMRPLIEIGVSFDNSTGAEAVLPYLAFVDCVQVMGIARVGFQDQPLDDRVFYNIERIKHAVPDMVISVDGAVGKDTIQRLADVGVTRFVAGSAVFHDDTIEDNISELEDLIA